MMDMRFNQHTALKSSFKFLFHAGQTCGSTRLSRPLGWRSHEHQKYLNGFSNITLLLLPLPEIQMNLARQTGKDWDAGKVPTLQVGRSSSHDSD